MFANIAIDTPRGTTAQVTLETERLRLRRWQRRDVEPFSQMNRDYRVMAYAPGLLSPMQSLAAIDRFEQNFVQLGYGHWAVETQAGAFVGCVGLEPYLLPSPISRQDTACTAMSWYLSPPYWRQGLAYEAAQAVIDDASRRLYWRELIAITHTVNFSAVSLCHRLGMVLDATCLLEDIHWPATYKLRRQSLYRLDLREVREN